jgi:hypothetical protein
MGIESIREEYKQDLASLPNYSNEREYEEGTDIFIMFKPDFLRTLDINGNIDETARNIEIFLQDEVGQDIILKFLVITPGLLEEQLKEIYKDTYWKKFLNPLYEKISSREATVEEIQTYNEHLQFFCGGEGPLALLVVNTPYQNKEYALSSFLEWRDHFRENYPYLDIRPNGIYTNALHVDSIDNAFQVLLEYGYKNQPNNISY